MGMETYGNIVTVLIDVFLSPCFHVMACFIGRIKVRQVLFFMEELKTSAYDELLLC